MAEPFEQQVATALKDILSFRHWDELLDDIAPRVAAALRMANRTGREWNIVYDEALARDPTRPGINWEDVVLRELRDV